MELQRVARVIKEAQLIMRPIIQVKTLTNFHRPTQSM